MCIVDEIGCWKLGTQNARNILTQDNLFTNEEFNFSYLSTLPNVVMLRPCGRLIRFLDGSNALINLNLEEDEDEES